VPTRVVDRPLRRDVRLLGRLLGEVLTELEGEELFALEERIRTLAIQRRRGPREGRSAAGEELAATLDALPIERAEPIIRAFSLYFRLVNLAEQHHRIRRARAHANEHGAPPQRGSLAAVVLAAREAGVSAERARAAIGALTVTLTFTAHPTEAARRTVLEKLYRIARRLEERDRTQQTPREHDHSIAAIREEIALLWVTDDVRREKPSVGDEVKHTAFYVEEILWDLLPAVSGELARAFERAYGEPLGVRPIPLRFHAWPGGDMDGNPNVSPDVVEDAIRAYRARGLRRLITGVKDLGGSLSHSIRHVVPPPSLLDSIARDAERMPQLAAELGPRTEGEPWRRKLRYVEARLMATLAGVQRQREGARQRRGEPTSLLPEAPLLESVLPEAAVPYRDGSELLADLDLVADSLHEAGCAHAGEREARDLADRVRALGLTIAELELRAPATDVREGAAFADGEGPRTPAGSRILEALARVAKAQREAGEAACRTLVLSMAESERDVLAALRCARQAGLWDEARGAARLDVVPLFETLEALDASPGVLTRLFADPTYARHLAARGGQEVMVGYSDSGKEVGLLAASAALRRALVALPAIAKAARVPLTIFHGRGESVARGGGPAQGAILALPPGSVAGHYKATEQGEALDQKYGRPELAMRTIELIAGGALLHTLDATVRPLPEDEARYVAAFDELAAYGRDAYRSLVWEDPRFVELFTTATPIEEIALLPIGSRPSKRRAGGLEALRAIPWVFAWTQTRAILPGWYGVGTALERFAERPGGLELLQEMAHRFPFFRSVIDNVEMVLAKSDMAIAARYADLAPDAARKAVWPRIVAEHVRTRRWIGRVLDTRVLLEQNPYLGRSIALRNPYVDPLSYLQVALIRRKRAGDPRCDRPILLTINGVAGGLRNTG
jgi:phosphoenolpyruvate carboxylase